MIAVWWDTLLSATAPDGRAFFYLFLLPIYRWGSWDLDRYVTSEQWARIQTCRVRCQVSLLNHLASGPKLQACLTHVSWVHPSQGKRLPMENSAVVLAGGREAWWEIPCLSLPGVLGKAFPERTGTFVDETHQPSGSASCSRKHDQLLTLTPGQEGAAH